MTRDEAHEVLANKAKAAVAAYASDLARRGFDTKEIHGRCAEYSERLGVWYRSSIAKIDSTIAQARMGGGTENLKKPSA